MKLIRLRNTKIIVKCGKCGQEIEPTKIEPCPISDWDRMYGYARDHEFRSRGLLTEINL